MGVATTARGGGGGGGGGRGGAGGGVSCVLSRGCGVQREAWELILSSESQSPSSCREACGFEGLAGLAGGEAETFPGTGTTPLVLRAGVGGVGVGDAGAGDAAGACDFSCNAGDSVLGGLGGRELGLGGMGTIVLDSGDAAGAGGNDPGGGGGGALSVGLGLAGTNPDTTEDCDRASIVDCLPCLVGDRSGPVDCERTSNCFSCHIFTSSMDESFPLLLALAAFFGDG